MKLNIIFLIISLVLFSLIVYFILENKKAKKELDKEKKNLLYTIVVVKKELGNSQDSVTKNILSVAELGGNIVGCIYGYCGGGSATIGLITNRIK